jgi:hypothetical protein
MPRHHPERVRPSDGNTPNAAVLVLWTIPWIVVIGLLATLLLVTPPSP